MSRQTLAVMIGAIALFGVAVVGAMAFTGGNSSSGGGGHTMPDGSMMSDAEMGHMTDETTLP